MKQRAIGRRLIAGAVGLLIGAAGALAISSPALAHHTNVNAEAVCDTETGEWVITWTVTSSNDAEEYEITELEVDPAELGAPDLPTGEARPIDQAFTGEQRVPLGSDDTITLTVHAEWDNGVENTSHGSIDLSELSPDEACAGPPAVVFPVFNCDVLVFFLVNFEAEDGASFTLTPNEDATHGHAPSLLEFLDEILEADPGTTIEVPEETSLEGADTVDGGDPVGPLGPFDPEDAHAHGFEAFEGLEVTYELFIGDESVASETFSWDELVDEAGFDCDEEGEGGELPKTGSPMILIGGAALALLAVGGGLYLVARRRRIAFTA